MESNTQTLVNIYNKLGQLTAADGTPILSVTSPDGSTFYLQQRTFDPSTGIEGSPELTVIDVNALTQSAIDVQNDTASVSALQDLVTQITASPTQPITISPAMPAKQITH